MSISPCLRDSITVNDVRRLLCRLRYNESSQEFYSRVQGKGVDRSKELHLTLLSAHDHNSHVFRDLHVRVSQIETPLFDSVKQVWNQFYQSVQRGKPDEIWSSYQRLSSSFPLGRERLKDFEDTDLMLCENAYVGPVPLANLLQKSELDPLLIKYSDFIQRIQIDSSGSPQVDPNLFKEQVKRDVRMLLSVPLGRQLIDRIMANMKPETKITIYPSDRFYYQKVGISESDPDSHRIQYSVNPAFFYQNLPSVGLRSLSSPPFIVLAHEFLHLVHMMEGTFYHDLNPLLDTELETNEEEMHVIRNLKCCFLHEPDPCNEETLRTQLGLPVRFFHLYACKPSDPPDLAYVRALKVGAKMEVEAAFERGVSGPVLAKHMHILSPGTVDKFRQIAARKPECRSGPFHPAAQQAGPIIRVPEPVRLKRAAPPVPVPQEAKVLPPQEKKHRVVRPPALPYLPMPLQMLTKLRPVPIIIPPNVQMRVSTK